MPRCEIPGEVCLPLLDSTNWLSKVVLSVYTLPSSEQEFQFLHVPIYYFWCFQVSICLFANSGRYVVLSDWSLICVRSWLMNGEGNGNPFRYPCLKNPMDGGAWEATVHGVTKSWTRLRDSNNKCLMRGLLFNVFTGWQSPYFARCLLNFLCLTLLILIVCLFFSFFFFFLLLKSYLYILDTSFYSIMCIAKSHAVWLASLLS